MDLLLLTVDPQYVLLLDLSSIFYAIVIYTIFIPLPVDSRRAREGRRAIAHSSLPPLLDFLYVATHDSRMDRGIILEGVPV